MDSLVWNLFFKYLWVCTKRTHISADCWQWLLWHIHVCMPLWNISMGEAWRKISPVEESIFRTPLKVISIDREAFLTPNMLWTVKNGNADRLHVTFASFEVLKRWLAFSALCKYTMVHITFREPPDSMASEKPREVHTSSQPPEHCGIWAQVFWRTALSACFCSLSWNSVCWMASWFLACPQPRPYASPGFAASLAGRRSLSAAVLFLHQRGYPAASSPRVLWPKQKLGY